MKNNSKVHVLLFIVVLIGAFLRFYNFDWGAGNFFHPDERNIAIAIASLDFQNGDFNPNFFAYGSFPIYIVYLFSRGDFELSILYGRLISAFFSTVSLLLIFQISKTLLTGIIHESHQQISNLKKPERYALAITAICAFSPGLIQFAHFTTFETFLLFEYLLFLYISIKLIQRPSWAIYFLLAVILGLAVATKVVSLFLVVVFVGVHVLAVLKHHKSMQSKARNILNYLVQFLSVKFLFSLIISACVFVVTNPFMILDFQSFRNSLDYESAVATGSQIVFYTQQFQETTPAIYQFLYVLPSQVSWPITVLGVISILILSVYALKHAYIFVFKDRKNLQLPLFVFLAIFYGYAIFHLYLFVKWTRYMLPLIPFLIIATGVVFARLSISKKSFFRLSGRVLFTLITIIAFIQGLNFFTIYLQPDSHIVASTWLAENSSPEDTFLGETYDIGMTSFNNALGNHRITELDIYHIDDGFNDSAEVDTINALLEESEYVIVPAERIYPTRSRLPELYPNGYTHYDKLFSEKNGFVKVAQFDRRTYLEKALGISFYSSGLFQPLNYDETFKVFDQTTITIFKKT